MDDPLVPQEMSPLRRKMLLAGLSIAGLFVAITLILTFVQGAKAGHQGFIALAFCLMGFCAVTGVTMNWIRKGYLDDPKVRILANALAANLMFLCVCVLIVVFPMSAADKCLSHSNSFGIASPVPFYGHCFAKPDCFGSPNYCLLWSEGFGYSCGFAANGTCRA